MNDPNLPGYSRSGNDLIYTYKLSLSDALTDCSLRIPTLDQRIISIACPEVVSPYYEKRVPGMIYIHTSVFCICIYIILIYVYR